MGWWSLLKDTQIISRRILDQSDSTLHKWCFFFRNKKLVTQICHVFSPFQSCPHVLYHHLIEGCFQLLRACLFLLQCRTFKHGGQQPPLVSTGTEIHFMSWFNQRGHVEESSMFDSLLWQQKKDRLRVACGEEKLLPVCSWFVTSGDTGSGNEDTDSWITSHRRDRNSYQPHISVFVKAITHSSWTFWWTKYLLGCGPGPTTDW